MACTGREAMTGTGEFEMLGAAVPAADARNSGPLVHPGNSSGILSAMKTLLSLFAMLLLALPMRTDAQSGNATATRFGTVTVFRSRDDSGSGYSLTFQNQTLAKLKSGTYVVLQLPEGRQYLLADPTAKQLYQIDVKAGAEHYAEVVTEGNLLRRIPTLVAATAQEFESLRPSLKEIQPRP